MAIRPLHTLKSEGRGEYRERGSRFLSFSFPLFDATELRERLSLLRAEHSQARHVCHGAVLPGGALALSDDGEPGGTAGRPITDAIRAAGLDAAGILVVRYFGGVKLGVPGLIAAYRTAADSALQDITIVSVVPSSTRTLRVGYEGLHRLMPWVKGQGGRVHETRYGESCELVVELPSEAWEPAIPHLMRLGAECLEETGRGYIETDSPREIYAEQ